MFRLIKKVHTDKISESMNLHIIINDNGHVMNPIIENIRTDIPNIYLSLSRQVIY